MLHRSLLADMREALLAEFGALEAYRVLARCVRDEELEGVLARFSEEEQQQVLRLREVMSSLGARPRKGSVRRRLAARMLAGSSRIFGARFVLRICQDAEETVARWYYDYAVHLARIGELEAARTCQELSHTKARHARTLNAWVENLPLRRG